LKYKEGNGASRPRRKRQCAGSVPAPAPGGGGGRRRRRKIKLYIYRIWKKKHQMSIIEQGATYGIENIIERYLAIFYMYFTKSRYENTKRSDIVVAKKTHSALINYGLAVILGYILELKNRIRYRKAVITDIKYIQGPETDGVVFQIKNEETRYITILNVEYKDVNTDPLKSYAILSTSDRVGIPVKAVLAFRTELFNAYIGLDTKIVTKPEFRKMLTNIYAEFMDDPTSIVRDTSTTDLDRIIDKLESEQEQAKILLTMFNARKRMREYLIK
jgi:hypothetical protein